MLKSLPPVGNPISLTPVDEPEKIVEAVFGDNSVYLYESGTMALAASLMAAREFRAITSPEVLMPAYACPDLVSAALFAGMKPILVDLEPNTPWMDLDRLKALASSNTVAVIATHFLGIPERLKEIRTALDGTAALLIEDSAQLFPTKPTERVWEGDLVILSFGRGKPVSLLGGGAVLCRNTSLAEHLPLGRETVLKFINQGASQLYELKIRLYNALLSPGTYGLLEYVPFLKLGETIYHSLEEILPFPGSRTGLLAANIRAYQARQRNPQQWISKMLANIGGSSLLDLATISDTDFNLPLLRYPILVKDPDLRDKLGDALNNKGLGCSIMYPQPLSAMPGLSEYFNDQGEFPHAEQFSRRLLTLPCHTGVTSSDVQAMQKVIVATLPN